MGEARLTEQDSNNLPGWMRNIPARLLVSNEGVHLPQVIDMENKNAISELQKIVKNKPIVRLIDNYEEQLAELYISTNAQLYKANLSVKQNSIKSYLEEHYGKVAPWQKGSWVYYPWSGHLIHVLEAELYWQLHSVRNQVLLTDQEQTDWCNYRVGCAGMSVGSNGAIGIALTSGSKQLKLSDGAVFSGSNLNRVRTGIANIGLNKSIVIAREIYEMNPYVQIDVTPKNITEQNITDFFTKSWPLDLIIDEIDDLETKVRLRLEAKRLRIPLIMVTEPGNQIMLDVERYDLDAKTQIFNGLAPGVEQLLEKKDLSQREKLKFIAKIIGLRNLPLRDQQAMIKVGATIPSAPQLGSTAMMAGGIIAFAARELATRPENLKSGRHIIAIEHLLTHEVNSREYKKQHRKHSDSIQRAMESM